MRDDGGAARRVSQVSSTVTGTQKTSRPSHVWALYCRYGAIEYGKSGAAEPMTSATPSNQRRRANLNGSTAAAWDGKVIGTRRA